jgi:hypothetical protein
MLAVAVPTARAATLHPDRTNDATYIDESCGRDAPNATDAAGNHSPLKRLSFRVVR